MLRPVSLSVLSLLLLLSACQEERVRGGAGDVRLQPEAIAFEPTAVGAFRTQALQLHNTSRAARAVSLELAAPFRVDRAELSLAGGEQVSVSITFEPTALGEAKQELRVVVEGEAAQVPLSGEGIAAACPLAAACQEARVDPGTGECALHVLEDGTPCSDVCLEPGTSKCSGGACVGTSRSCDDQDACTMDLCVAGVGCAQQPLECSTTDPCLVPLCDPVTGCGTAFAADGTLCGRNGCDVQDVCVRGQCVEKLPPDGAVCGEPSMCQGYGTCAAGVCERPAPTPIAQVWSYSAPSTSWLHFTGVADPSGPLFAEGSRESADAGAYLLALDASGQELFKEETFSTPSSPTSGMESPVAIMGGRLITSRRLSQHHGEIVARSPATGALLWTSDLQSALSPHFPPPQYGAPRGALPQAVFESASGGVRVAVDLREGPAPNGGIWTTETFVVDLDSATGAVVQHARLDQPTTIAAIGAGDELFAHRDGQLLRLSATSQLDWATPPADPVQSQGLVALFHSGARLIAVDQAPYANGTGGQTCWRLSELVIVDPASGAELGRPGFWVTSLDREGRVVARNGTAWAIGWTSAQMTAACTDDSAPGSLAAIDLATGTLQWAEPFPSPSGTAQLLDGFTLTSRGTLWAVGTQASNLTLYELAASDGHLIGACPVDTPYVAYSTGLTLLDDVFVLHSRFPTGRLRAFDATGYTLPATGWPTTRGNLQRTGRER